MTAPYFSHLEEPSGNVVIPYFDEIHLSRAHARAAEQLLDSSSLKVENVKIRR